MALFCRGHCLLIGVPGLAKTLMISTLSKVLSLSFNRIQFTPDLMPSDITGTEVIQEDKASGNREFKFLQGPDLRQRDPRGRDQPHAAEDAGRAARGDAGVPGHGRRRTPRLLEKPFFVLATQNPIEQEGTYPLPEAQLDRFMFMVKVDYPTAEEEREILRRTTEDRDVEIKPVLGADEIFELQEIVRRVPIADHVLEYALRLARQTRLTTGEAPEWVKEWLQWGAGPRASQNLVLGAKAHALLQGRFYVVRRGHPRRRQAGAAPPPDHQLRGRGRWRHDRQGHRPPARRDPPNDSARCSTTASCPRCLAVRRSQGDRHTAAERRGNHTTGGGHRRRSSGGNPNPHNRTR